MIKTGLIILSILFVSNIGMTQQPLKIIRTDNYKACLDMYDQNKVQEANTLLDEWQISNPEDKASIENLRLLSQVTDLKHRKDLVDIARQTLGLIHSAEDMKNAGEKMKNNINQLAAVFPQNDLIDAIDHNDKAKVEELLKKDSTKIDEEYLGITNPLTTAVTNGLGEMVLVLLQHGANINHINKVGSTPLMRAVIAKKEDMVKLLVEKGADVNIKNSANGKTALDSALKSGNETIIAILKNAK